MREKPSLQAAVIGKIPYATKLSIDNSKVDTANVVVENMNGNWVPVTYQNKKGYVLNCYLTRTVPPKKGTANLKDYLKQITTAVGAPVKLSKGNVNSLYEGGFVLTKQLYKNAASWHQCLAYEYSADIFYLPELSIQEAFILLRQVKEFENFFTEKDELPITNKTIKRKIHQTEDEIKIEVKTENYGSSKLVNRIEAIIESGPFQKLVIETLDTGEVMISISYSV
jgi:hypothetical protein